MDEATAGNGSFRHRNLDLNTISIGDFYNPWNFYSLLLQPDDVVYLWMRNRNLLAESINCEKCGSKCSLNKRAGKRGGYTFRCLANRNHEFSMFKFSFFDRGHTDVRDVLQFIKAYMDGLSLKQCSIQAGVNYSSTAVKWASFVREIFVDYFSRHLTTLKLSGEIEIDESLFGRKWKHHRGKNTAARVWIFGMVERKTNRILLYPVDQRNEETLCGLIKKRVEDGSKIYSDSWAAYLNLNAYGYQHFSVVHKTSFKQSYKNIETGEIVNCHTNQIEGAWKHAKDHFKRINGTSLDNFESHLCEVMWRCHQRDDIYSNFFKALKEIYTLDKEPKYHYEFPIFDTWSKREKGDGKQTIVPESQCDFPPDETSSQTCTTDEEPDSINEGVSVATKRAPALAEIEYDYDFVSESEGMCRKKPVLTDSSEDYIPLKRTVKGNKKQVTSFTTVKPSRQSSRLATSSTIQTGATGGPDDMNLRDRSEPTYSRMLAFPKGFKPRGKKPGIKTKTPASNPYTKDNFVNISTDSDSV